MFFSFFFEHWDSITGTCTNVMLVRLTYMVLPQEQKGHVRRGARVVMSLRMTVSRSERLFVRVYRADERAVAREVERVVEHVEETREVHREVGAELE